MTNEAEAATAEPAVIAPGRRKLLLLAPLGIAVVGGAAFLAMLSRLGDGSFDPHGIPSPLIGKPIPRFTLPLQPRANGPGGTLDSASLTNLPRPILLNFFASWCVPCVEEAPTLEALRAGGVPIIGVAYKDHAEATARFLDQNGDPYARLARDEAGGVAIDFGLYGVPETYVIDRGGIIRARFAGALPVEGVRAALAKYA